jgi:hypothetical protein
MGTQIAIMQGAIPQKPSSEEAADQGNKEESKSQKPEVKHFIVVKNGGTVYEYTGEFQQSPVSKSCHTAELASHHGTYIFNRVVGKEFYRGDLRLGQKDGKTYYTPEGSGLRVQRSTFSGTEKVSILKKGVFADGRLVSGINLLNTPDKGFIFQLFHDKKIFIMPNLVINKEDLNNEQAILNEALKCLKSQNSLEPEAVKSIKNAYFEASFDESPKFNLENLNSEKSNAAQPQYSQNVQSFLNNLYQIGEQGKITSIDATADPQTRGLTVNVRAKGNPDVIEK